MYAIALALVVIVVLVANIVATEALVRRLFDFAENDLALATAVMTLVVVYVIRRHEAIAVTALRVLRARLGMRRGRSPRRRGNRRRER